MTLSKSCHQVFQVFQVFQVLHLTLCPASPPPEHNFLVFLHFSGTRIAMIRRWLTHVFKCKRKFCGLFIFRSHQLLIVWKVSRRLTWESLGRRLQKILRMLQKNQVLLKNFQIHMKSQFLDEYQESLGDRLEKHRKQVLPICPKFFPHRLLAQESAFSEVKGQSVLGEVSETIATWKDGLGIKLEVKKLLAFSYVLKCWTFVFSTRTLVYTGWHRRTVESGSLTFLPFSFKYWDNT